MTKEEQYFTWDNFDEIVELEKHFSFIEDMIDKYKWKECDNGEFVNEIETIKRKQKKEKIVISVVGETSTGKSAFINALLKVELLISSVLQKTTTVPTIIEYAQDYRIEILKENGEAKELVCSGVEELRSKVTEYTTVAETTKDIVKVYVRLPAKILSDGFVIIDTPALNSGIPWNEVEHIKVLEENSDAIIVLTDINKAFPQTLIQCIRARFSDSLKKCIFLATKCDVIYNNSEDSEAQIKKVLDYIKIKLQGDFDLKNAVVLPYAAQDVIDDCYSEGNPEKELLDLSQSTEDTITTLLSKTEFFQRKNEQLLSLKLFYDTMFSKMQYLLSEYEQQIKNLQNIKNQNLTIFLYDLAQHYKKRCDQEIGKIIIESADTMYSEGLRGIRDLTYGKETSVAEIDNQISMILQETGLLIDNLLKKLITEHRNDIKKRFYDLNICIEGENNDAIVVDIGTSSVNSLKDCLKWLQNSTGNVGIHTNLLKIVDEVTGIMKEFVGCYTDSKSGIFACEIGKYQSKYSEKYEQAVEAWYVKEKKEEMDDWKNKVEDLQEDIIRVDNRRFSVDSARTQLKRKMEKNSR